MKYLTIFLLLLLSACNDRSSERSAESALIEISESDREELRSLKTEKWPMAYMERDIDLLDMLLHPNFKLIDDNGDAYSKEDELNYVKEFGPSYSDSEYAVTSIDLYDNGSAVILGAGTFKGQDSDGIYITKYAFSDFAIKKGDDWQVVLSHISGVKEERFDAAPTE